MPKFRQLPPYVSVTKTGIYRYRRTVPEPLRKHVGKREIKESLGKDYTTMLKKAAELEGLVTTLFSQKPNEGGNHQAIILNKMKEYGLRAQTVAAVAMGVDVKNKEEMGATNALGALIDDLANEPAEPLVPEELIRGLSEGQIPVTLESALDDYQARRIKANPRREKVTVTTIERHKTVLREALGKAMVNDKMLTRLRRIDARAVRDHMFNAGLAPSSVRRRLNDISAAVNEAIREYDLEMINPFHKLEVPNSQHRRDQRLPLDNDDMKLLAPIMDTDDDLGLIWQTMRDTGARLGEIVGLRCRDLDVANNFIAIRSYGDRGLKTSGSERDVPIPEDLTVGLQKLKGNHPDEPLFPRYDRVRGEDSCSQTLMKRLRKVIKDDKKAVDSLRHRFKDLLRDTDCPETLAREIMGHSDQSSAANYGRGSALKRKRKAMEKTWVRQEI
ncbi:tyrosine-type recombinase/integrase [Cohaesibacter intestini]|uniref:tyrosine-type recombinase/integrase n=1 Tax=Cohaesibacter intestini TaxID=2211145 RepID=UPI000DEA1DFC|nr:tyrosine-type recombinase/integrase [Cohaesibacter intestini]